MNRYLRHTLLEEVGDEGQNKINKARILVVGAGGLGSPILLYLAAAGIGTLGFIDDDTVSETNLQRQILYDTTSLGQKKVDIAYKKLKALNPMCKLLPIYGRFDKTNAANIAIDYDIIVDASDNLTTRYIIDDVCQKKGIPMIYGSICEFKGQISVFNYNNGPSYKDLFPYSEEINNFTQALGVIGVLPGVIGSLQAAEALKIILGREKEVLSGKLLLIDLLKTSFQTINFE